MTLNLGSLYRVQNRLEEAVALYEQLTSGRLVDWTLSPARIYAALGRAEAAVPLLVRELSAPPSGRWPLTPALLRLDPIWDKLRGNAGFQALLVEPTAPEDAGKK